MSPESKNQRPREKSPVFPEAWERKGLIHASLWECHTLIYLVAQSPAPLSGCISLILCLWFSLEMTVAKRSTATTVLASLFQWGRNETEKSGSVCKLCFLLIFSFWGAIFFKKPYWQSLKKIWIPKLGSIILSRNDALNWRGNSDIWFPF